VKFTLTAVDLSLWGWWTEPGNTLKGNASVTLNGKARVTRGGRSVPHSIGHDRGGGR
jgi:hypothetical protein